MENALPLGRPLDLVSRPREYYVLASLPANSLSFASKAEEAGADAIILNVDGDDGSAPGHLGSYELHDASINEVISTVSVPCGIFIGGAKPLTEEYWERVVSSQCSFVEMYAHHLPLYAVSDSRVKKLAAIGAGYILEQVRQISEIDGLEAVDAATVPPLARNSPLSVLDFATLGVIVSLSSKPVLLRTQKRLTKADIDRVVKLGIKGLVIDDCILSGVEEAYREELESLSPRREEPDQNQEPSGSDSGGRARDQTEALHLLAPEADAPGGSQANS